MAGCGATTEEAQLVLRNDLPELERLVPFVEEYARRAGLPPATAYAIQLCADEAVSNVVRHGGPEGRASSIAVRLRSVPGATDLLIVDDGAPFDPTRVPPPRPAASLEDVRIGGLGVHLMRKFSTAMHYERRGSENRLTLTFARSPA